MWKGSVFSYSPSYVWCLNKATPRPQLHPWPNIITIPSYDSFNRNRFFEKHPDSRSVSPALVLDLATFPPLRKPRATWAQKRVISFRILLPSPHLSSAVSSCCRRPVGGGRLGGFHGFGHLLLQPSAASEGAPEGEGVPVLPASHWAVRSQWVRRRL